MGAFKRCLEKKGITVGVQDLYIAATAQINTLSIVTLNLKDFKNINISILNPWEIR